MPSDITIVLGDYPHTRRVKAQGSFAGATATFPFIVPVHEAFDDMVRSQRYDFCEMAIVAFLQARESHHPLLLLPVVMMGGFHHGSLFASPVNPPPTPADLAGRRVGVRSFSQTTGLWVRALLEEEYGVRPQDVTWVTTEGSHAEEYEDPPYVERTRRSLLDELRSGGIAAAILVPGDNPGLRPLIADPDAAARAWYRSPRTVPVNHLVVTTEAVARARPQVVAAVYRALTAGVEEARRDAPPGGEASLPSSVTYGFERLRTSVELAARYAASQGLIAKVPDVPSLFADVRD